MGANISFPMPNSSASGNLVLVLGDQLSPELSSLAAADPATDYVLMVEVAEEATYVRHHKKKIALILAAMRHFAAELTAAGWRVDYVTLDDPGNTGNFDGEVARAVARHHTARIIVTEPGEWRVLEIMRRWPAVLGMPVTILPDDRFVASIDMFKSWAGDKKQLRMEYFYREMRRKTGLLMQGPEPEGGRWNFDADNRKPVPKGMRFPTPLRHSPDAATRDVLKLVADRFAGHFGDLEPFWFPVTRTQAEASFALFVSQALPSFGDYQDAMASGEQYLFHGVVALAMNIGLLNPLAMCQQVEAAYHDGQVPLPAAEGFIRQIIGWREFVRGIYWLKMPGYTDLNYFGNTRALPWFYWSGETDMACLAAAIGQTKAEAYAHHIQRLMLTGNFALIAGIAPSEVHAWYLTVYADAFEWVEAPNTLGMSQFADGGLLGSKPYVSSGARAAGWRSRRPASSRCRDRQGPTSGTGPS